ncbi:NMUR2 [Acanthosepion pharaonis]|uniref:NMUR2 n=1 Tax=Acanthosepion pharaonis TaxID=158019 RepID=A0A812D8Z8_ACAPH|nr:NMUR2 [Sepia pharaonis]
MAYAYPYRLFAKIQKFVTYYYCVSSAFVLLTISVERYFLVCRATKAQMTSTQARLLVGIIIFISGLLVIPVTVSFDMASLSLTPNVTITQCYFRHTPLAWAYYVSLFPANLTILILMFILYYQVEKQLVNICPKGQSETSTEQQPISIQFGICLQKETHSY